MGGKYRLGNAFPDGRVVWIVGTFERISPPHELVYTWRVEGAEGPDERVTVRFDDVARGTKWWCCTSASGMPSSARGTVGRAVSTGSRGTPRAADTGAVFTRARVASSASVTGL